MADDVVSRPLGLAFSADEPFAMALAVAMRSALVHLSAGVAVDLYVLDNGLSNASRERLSKIVTDARKGSWIRWLPINSSSFGELGHFGGLNNASYARLLLPDLVSPELRRIVYLDADVLVKRDLSPLLAMDLGGAPLAAVRDFRIHLTTDEESGVLDPKNPRPYLNAGVLVVDVGRWRALRLTPEALSHASGGTKFLRWGDQDALNTVLRDWHELDYRWNVQQSPETLFSLEAAPVRSEREVSVHRARRSLNREAFVLHFVSEPKPWHHACTTAGAGAWIRALLRTGWLTPREATAWLARVQLARARYRLGVTRKRFRAALAQPDRGSSGPR